MYIVKINNGGEEHIIHGYRHKLSSGKVVKGINTIDTFSMTLSPANIGFDKLREYKTLVTVYNTNKHRYEFQGRVLLAPDAMSDKGEVKREATCESLFGYFCDSQQDYVYERNWTVRGLLEYIVNAHNEQVEPEKRFTVRTVTVTDLNNNLYCGIQYENTWETIKKKLIEVLGGELSFEVGADTIYLDYVPKLGETKTTKIALSRNMKSISREKDPTAFITRLIPLGAKVADDSEERLTIATVNAGNVYIDDAEAIEKYGIHVGYVQFDDVTEADNLLTKGRNWLAENNKVQVKYSITAVDLSLIGKDIDDFDVYNYYPIENALLGIYDTARIIKKTIDVCEEIKSTIEIGDNFKTLSELQKEQAAKINYAANTIATITANYVTNQKLSSALTEERTYTTSLINQLSDQITLGVTKEEFEAYKADAESALTTLETSFASAIDMKANEISLSVAGSYVKNDTFNTYKSEASAELALKVGKDDNGQIVSMLNASADSITIKGNRLSISSTNFTLTAAGDMTASKGSIGGWNIGKDYLGNDYVRLYNDKLWARTSQGIDANEVSFWELCSVGATAKNCLAGLSSLKKGISKSMTIAGNTFTFENGILTNLIEF